MVSKHQNVWWFYTRADRQKLKEQSEGQGPREGQDDKGDQERRSGAEQR